jgi:hypothetical protein
MPSAVRLPSLVLLIALSGAAPVRAQGLHLLPGIEEIASDTIADIAVAAVDRPEPVIYFNPAMVRRYGPLLTRFFLAHEYGHIYHRHTRAGLADTPEATRDSILRAQELEADCYAAGQEGAEARAATEAALRFFARLGPFRFDNVHPTGAQRAARILLCLPGPREPVLYGRGETGVEMGPVSGEPDRVRFAVRASPLEESAYGNEAVLWMDGLRIGAGIHTYRLAIDVYSVDAQLQISPTGSVSGRGHVLVQNGDRFRIEWIPGQAPALVPDSE